LISNVVMDISKFLGVASTVRLSMTDRALRGLLVHDPGGPHPQIKAAAFVLAEYDDAPNAPSMLAVLPRLHFPSLRQFEVRFPPGAPLAELKGALSSLAAGLRRATELEELFVDVKQLLTFEKCATAFCQLFYRVLAKSLANCTKLRRLKASNHLKPNPARAQSFYSTDFLRALVPAIERGENTLEEVSLVVGNCPVVVPADDANGRDARDLFGAALRLRRLRGFNLQLDLASGPLLKDFLEACDEHHRLSGTLPSGNLENLSLTCVLYRVPDGVPNPLPSPPSLSPLLFLLKDSSGLRSFVARVPPACWDSRGISALGCVLSSKPKLRRLFLDFHGYECRTGKTLKCVLDYVRERKACHDNLVQISGLICDDDGGFDEEKELDQYYCREGKKCRTEKSDGLTFKARGCLIRW